MGHHSFEDNSHKKHKKRKPKPIVIPPPTPPGAILGQGILLNQIFLNTPLTPNIIGTTVLYTTAPFTQAGVVSVNCVFSIDNPKGEFTEFYLEVIRGPGFEVLATASNTVFNQSIVQMSIFWNGIVAVGDIIFIQVTGNIDSNSIDDFGVSEMFYSLPAS